MPTTAPRTVPAQNQPGPPPVVTGVTDAAPAPPQADAQPAHWGDGIALRLWALGFLLMLTLLAMEAVSNLLR